MHEADLNRVVFYSKPRYAGWYPIEKSRRYFKKPYKLKLHWHQRHFRALQHKKIHWQWIVFKGLDTEDITEFKQKVTEYGKVIGQFILSVDDSTVIEFYKETLRNTLIHFGN